MTLIDVGTPPSGYQLRDTNLVAFHEFASLPAKVGHAIDSSIFFCFQHMWKLELYPGGYDDENGGKVCVFLRHMSSGSVAVRYSFTVKNVDGHAVDKALVLSASNTFAGFHDAWGFTGYAKRSKIMNALVKGTLIIEVRMKLLDPDGLTFIPANPSSNVLHKFLGEAADVVFAVDNRQQRRSTRSSFDSSHVKFRGHQDVIEDYAPKLLKNIVRDKGSDVARVLVNNIRPDVFGLLLRYAYGGDLPGDALRKHSKEIIEAAKRYEMIPLKLRVEAWFVQTEQTTEETVAEHLVFATKHQLALLKESALDFIVKSGYDIDTLPKDVKADLAGDFQRATNKNAGDKFGKMRVNELRKRLDEKDLDIGGSKKQMIDALREAAASDEEVTVCAANLGNMKV